MTARPLRAVLSALGIAIGIGAMVAVVGISGSSRQGLLDQLARLGTNLLRAAPGRTLFGDNATLPDQAEGMVARIAPVRSVTATGQTSVTVRRTGIQGPEWTGGIVVAAARTNLLGTIGGTVRAGRFLDAANGRYPAVVLGALAAQRLGLEPADLDRLGHPVQVWIGDRYFTVVGILDPVPLAPEIDRSALVGWPAAQRYLGFDGHPTTLYERSTDETVNDVHTVLAATVNPAHPDEVDVSRPSDALAAQAAVKGNYTALFLGLGAVALLVGGVGVANTMVISVLERRQEIGLRRALGASRRQIRGQFLAESVLLSGLGGLAGVLLGLAVTAGYATSQGWPVAVSPAVLAAGLALAGLVGAAAGAYPAGRAARLTPTEALTTA